VDKSFAGRQNGNKTEWTRWWMIFVNILWGQVSALLGWFTKLILKSVSMLMTTRRADLGAFFYWVHCNKHWACMGWSKPQNASEILLRFSWRNFEWVIVFISNLFPTDHWQHRFNCRVVSFIAVVSLIFKLIWICRHKLLKLILTCRHV